MLSKEQLFKDIKLISQNAWGVETNTTVNAICEYIIAHTINQVLMPELEALDLKYLVLQKQLDKLEGLRNGCKDGGLSEPEGNTQTSAKGSRHPTRSGRTDA